jgi:hypothetical protein
MPKEFTGAVFNLFLHQSIISSLLFLAGRLSGIAGGCFCTKKKQIVTTREQVIYIVINFFSLTLN